MGTSDSDNGGFLPLGDFKSPGSRTNRTVPPDERVLSCKPYILSGLNSAAPRRERIVPGPYRYIEDLLLFLMEEERV